jgi:voltage-gated potassium channel
MGRGYMKRLTHVQKRVIIALIILFILLFVIGPQGYMHIEDMSFTDAFFMTVSTIFTVGFSLIESSMSTAGIYFTIFLILFGVFALFFLISAVIDLTFREALSETFGRRRMDQRIKSLKNHHIVCGYGRVGEVVCDILSQAEMDFVVIENDPERIKEAEEEGLLYVDGDATETEALENAGVERAYSLVCALESDADNLFITLTGRFLNTDLIIVSRCFSPESEEKLRYAGADRVINPYIISGRRMATFLVRPGVYDYLDLVAPETPIEYRMEELLVQEGSRIDGRTIGELDIKARTGAMVTAVRKMESGEFNTNPDKDTRIDAGDLLIALGTEKDLAGLEELVL